MVEPVSIHQVKRRKDQVRPVRVLAITGGKGGVGKSNVAVNLGVALAQRGEKVLVLDADFGLSNIDILLGLNPEATLYHVLKGERSLDEIILEGPAGIRIIPSASGIRNMAEMSSGTHAGLIQAFSDLNMDIDTLIIDTATGISDSVISFTRAAQEVAVVVCDEPASIKDAYATIKILSREHGIFRFRILANMADGAQHGREIYGKMISVTDRFLDVALDYIGYVPQDEYLQKSVRKQRTVVEAFPRSKSAKAFITLADKVAKWPLPAAASGHLEFFVERLIQPQTTKIEAVS
jgi:flagellar biosynthesis protein FlhG